MRLSLIWAMAENGVIGRDGDLPWHLPRDLAHFKRTTRGHAVLMGRRTWESLPFPLPERRNLVVSRQPGFTADGAEVFPSVEAAIAAIGDESRAFVIGGAEIYRQTLPLADECWVTTVHATVDGDTRFEFDRAGWTTVEIERFEADERNEYACTIERLRRAE